MGKYAPVIKTAECGSMTRAAHVLGYTQPSLGYIINNIENDLGVKLFYRDQRGVTLTETGSDLLKLMRAARGRPCEPMGAFAGGHFRRGLGPVDAGDPGSLL